jgi:hypothetical protein
LALPAVALAVTPVDGGSVGGTVVTVNNGPGDQTDPHVSGNIAAYTDGTDPQSIRVYNFSTNVDSAITAPAGASDHLSDVSGTTVSFTRTQGGCDAVMIFNAVSLAITEIAPQVCAHRTSSAVGNTSVAFVDTSSLPTRVFVADIAGGAPTQLSSGIGSSQNPSVSPSGDAVVFEQCPSTVLNCDIMKSVRSGGVWGAAQAVANTASPEGNPDTDGTTVVYDANRAGSFTGQDVYFQPLAGGAETQLQIVGFQSKPSISSGVIAFESRATFISPGDIYIYVIATNTLFQVTNSPLIDEQLSDVIVLNNGDVRVVWAANDGLLGDFNIYARTFTLPGMRTPAQMIVDLIDKTLRFLDRMLLGPVLRAKLEHIASAVIQNNKTFACAQLNQYIAAVNATSWSALTTAEKAELIADANAVKRAIGCP